MAFLGASFRFWAVCPPNHEPHMIGGCVYVEGQGRDMLDDFGARLEEKPERI